MMRQQSTLFRSAVCVTLGLVVLHCTATASTDTQTYTVTVPSVLTITRPNAGVTITHDKTDNNQTFSMQQWTAQCNAANGATVEFETTTPFRHLTDATYQRNAKLDLVVGTPSDPTWTVSTASDQTNYPGDLNAKVVAGSTLPGDAKLDLTVTFITTDFSTLLVGDYRITVNALITANP